jgi:Zn-dependent protease with chaperone function
MGKSCAKCNKSLGALANYGDEVIPLCFDCNKYIEEKAGRLRDLPDHILMEMIDEKSANHVPSLIDIITLEVRRRGGIEELKKKKALPSKGAAGNGEEPGMTRDEVIALIPKLQAQYEKNPRLYRIKLIGIALMGYSYIAMIIMLLLVVMVGGGFMAVQTHLGAIFFKLGIPFLFLLLTILSSLWVRVPQPEGIDVTPSDTPELFKEISDIAGRINAPCPRHVLINGEFNAAVVQLPAFGLLGGVRNYLLLGLPVMETLSPDEFRSVLAHEIGHLSKSHGRLGLWLYKKRAVWEQLLQALEMNHGWGINLFRNFAKWYVPFFNCHEFLLARQHEIEADRIAAGFAGAAAAGNALMRMEIVAAHLDEQFWPEVHQRSRRQKDPPEQIHRELAEHLKTGIIGDKARLYLQRALQKESGIDDPHPSLNERLRSMGTDTSAPLCDNFKNAAELLLGGHIESIRTTLDFQWRNSIRDQWRQNHEEAEKARNELVTLETALQKDPHDTQTAWKRACILKNEGHDKEAREAVMSIIANDPAFAPAYLVSGQDRLKEADEKGLADLNRAMELDTLLTLSACEIAMDYLIGDGRKDEAETYRVRAEEFQEVLNRADHERDLFVMTDPIAEHGLSEDELQGISAQLKDIYPITAAFVVQKKVTLLSEHPVYVLGVQVMAGKHESKQEAFASVMDQMTSRLKFEKGTWFYLIMNLQSKADRSRFERVAGGAFYLCVSC